MKEHDYILIDAPNLHHEAELPTEFLSQLKKALLYMLMKNGLLSKDLYEQCLQNADFCSDIVL